MEKLFNMEIGKLKDLKAYNTAFEIYNQPKVWKDVLQIIKENQEKIIEYINNLLKKDNLRIIFTGAGTSAYVGDTIVNYLSKKLDCRVESVATTDIVSSPEDYLEEKTPTVLVSFARSGNSPESVGAYELSEKLVTDLSQIVITCNAEGNLAIKARENHENLLILMPEEANDKSFAMTSSFTSMVLTALIIFDMKNLEQNIKCVEKIIKDAQNTLNKEKEEIHELVKMGYERVIYLGSSALAGLSKEAALKNLELTSGKIITTCESVLGFRHGPKSMINNKTLVFIFLSNDKYTRMYDKDLLKEIYNDEGQHKVVAITYNKDEELENIAHKVITINKENDEFINDAYIALNYVVYAQVFAMLYSLQLGISPDNPRPDGTVNRVVKGVIIHDYKK